MVFVFSILLKQSLPLGFTAPPLKAGVTEDSISKQQADIWLNYW